MDTQDVKAATEAAFLAHLKDQLLNDPDFAVSDAEQEGGTFNFIASLSSNKFYHPSIVVCCERAPLLQEDMLLSEISVEVFLTTIARGDDFLARHEARLRKFQETLREDGQLLLTAMAAFDNRLTPYRLFAGESENFTDEYHWVDKQPFTVFLQFS